MSVSLPARSTESETSTLLYVMTAITLSTATATLAECLFRLLYDSWWRNTSTPGYYLLYATPVLYALIGSLAVAFALQVRRIGWLIVLASMTTSVYMTAHFRGSHRWPGFYDLNELSKTPYVLGLAGATSLGLLLYRLSSKPIALIPVWTLIAVSLTWTWIDALRGLSILTHNPYTRHLALSTLVALTGAVALARQFGWTFVEEDA